MARIGFIGLGHMGLPMAQNLLKAGHAVIGYDLQKSTLEQLVAAGGTAATTLASAAQEQDVIITMLQKGQQVLDVYNGNKGILAHASPDTLLIDSSTIDIDSAQKLHELARHHQLLAIDAPVSGGVTAATAGTLTFMVGGQEPAFKQAQPYLHVMGKKIIHTGGAGTGQIAKICNNLILANSMIAVSEAFTLGEKLGLDPQKLFEVASNSSGQCWALTHYVPVPNILEHVPANNNYQAGFAAVMMLKDLLLSQSAAKAAQIATPLTAKASELYQELIDKGWGAKDFSAIIQLINKTIASES